MKDTGDILGRRGGSEGLWSPPQSGDGVEGAASPCCSVPARLLFSLSEALCSRCNLRLSSKLSIEQHIITQARSCRAGTRRARPPRSAGRFHNLSDFSVVCHRGAPVPEVLILSFRNRPPNTGTMAKGFCSRPPCHTAAYLGGSPIQQSSVTARG